MSAIRAIRFLACGILVVAGLAATGCEQTRQAFGLSKQSPDEFAVVPRAPLAIPPNFSLRPPAPGARRPQEAPIPHQAREILVSGGRKAEPGPAKSSATAGEQALLNHAGAARTSGAIRAQVDRESAALADADKSFVDKLMFWREPEMPGKAVDAAAESKRIRENVALGEPITKGETAVIKRKERGWLEGLFN